VTEGATTGSYTISLGQAAATPVTVNLSYGGTATGGGTDYTGTTSVTIPAGATSVTFALPTTNDTAEGRQLNRRVEIHIQAPAQASNQ